MLNQLKNETRDEIKNGRVYPDFRAGDSIEVHKLPYMTAKKVDVIKGVVIRRVNKGHETSAMMVNVSLLTAIFRWCSLMFAL